MTGQFNVGPSQAAERVRAVWKLWLAGILVLLIMLVVIVELVLWVFWPATGSVRASIEQDIPGLSDHVVYERNDYGFRSLSMTSESKPANTIRIIALGASTTDQSTKNIEDTWSGILEHRLAEWFAGHDIRIEVAAYGRPGESVVDRLIWARRELHRYEPDIVVTLEGINDLWFHGGPGYRFEGLPPPDRLRNGLRSACLRYSQICRLAQLVKRSVAQERALEIGAASDWQRIRTDTRNLPFVERPVRHEDPIVEFEAGLDALAELVINTDAKLIMLGQPVLWKEEMTEEELRSLWSVATPDGSVRAGSRWLVEEMNRYLQVQDRVAKSLNVPLLDLDSLIPKSLQFYFDDCHFTNEGSRRVAEEIFPLARDAVESLLAENNY